MDAAKFPNPRTFDPSRFQNDKLSIFECATTSDTTKLSTRSFVFGAGRRICQGMHIAERPLFLAMARMLWAFDFKKALDDTGSPITPDISRLTQGFFVLPEAFPAVIEPRSESHSRLIRQAWDECEGTHLDRQTGQWKRVPDGMALSTYEPSKGAF